MEPSFWLDRWENDQIGFHRADENPALLAHWPALGVRPGARVLVPLCGKSVDMRWLRDRGHPVLGVELSEKAARAFFSEANIEASRRAEGPFAIHEGGGIEIWCGDFFELAEAELRTVRAVYDRAALVALPPEMRERYASILTERLPRCERLLTIAFEYDQSRIAGPPFAVLEPEVRALFGRAYSVEVLGRTTDAEPPPRFREEGVTGWQEVVYAMRR